MAIALEKTCVIIPLIEYCNERIEAQLSRLAPVSKARKAVAGVKGAAAEGGKLQPPPGHTENIRLTVAFAESYGLIAIFPRPFAGRDTGILEGSTADANGTCISCFLSHCCGIRNPRKGD